MLEVMVHWIVICQRKWGYNPFKNKLLSFTVLRKHPGQYWFGKLLLSYVKIVNFKLENMHYKIPVAVSLSSYFVFKGCVLYFACSKQIGDLQM